MEKQHECTKSTLPKYLTGTKSTLYKYITACDTQYYNQLMKLSQHDLVVYMRKKYIMPDGTEIPEDFDLSKHVKLYAT